MNYYQKKILLDLFESVNGLQPFTFYSRYRLKPEAVVELITSLESKDLVSIKNNTLYINEKGKSFIKNRKFSNRFQNKYENIPVNFIDEKLSINSYYIPNLSYISK
ncbi:hypothetical protein HZQ04_07825 [Elizabethkingia anophelis]|nr:hypothetical protein [Elizabethkingia anophelis]MCT4262375.1 hypothetical protein [Elizabethkingia anophelis]